MKHLNLFLILVFITIYQFTLSAQEERVVNWDFEKGVTGALSFRPGSAWNEFDFERNERWDGDSQAENKKSLHCRDNKDYVGKDNLGIGQYHGRAQSILPCPEPGAEYILSARARIQGNLGGEDPGEVALLFYGADETVIQSIILKFSNQTYEAKAKNFTVPSGAVWATVWVRKTAKTDFYADWVSLKAVVDDTPNAVSNFSASDVGATRVLLEWDPSQNAIGYLIERKKSTEGGLQWKTIFITHNQGNTTSFLDTRDSGFKTLEPGQTYNYRIYAIGDYGKSPFSNLTVNLKSLQSSPGNTTYYVNANVGDDSNSGTEPSKAWKTFKNIDELELSPGDKILLRNGHEWTEPLHIHGSGAANNKIVIGSYGIGGQKPKINVEGRSHAALQMIDVSYCKVKNLELSNYHPFFREMFKFAIRAGTWQSSSVEDLEFTNLFINKIRGSAVRGGNLGSISGGEMCAGIRVSTDIRGTDPVGKSIKNVKITNNVLLEVEHHAIQLQDVDQIKISNNRIKRPGYISLLTRNIRNGSIDNNYFIETGYYMTMADNAALDLYFSENIVVENNVIYKVYNDRSGQAINLDSCKDFIVQNNFMKESASGCFVINSAERSVFRYNITEGFNDEWFRNLGGYDTQIYNNTIYAYSSNHAAQGFFIRNDLSIEEDAPAEKTYVHNNIFIREQSVNPETTDLIYNANNTKDFHYSNNVYFGNFSDEVVEDSSPFFEDPELENPGSGFVDVNNYSNNPDGYLMKESSPYLESGLFINGNGGYDYWGNALPQSAAPTLGASQQGSSLPIELLDFRAFQMDNLVELEWETAWEYNNFGFEVQYSNDAKVWQVLTFVESKGDSELINDYKYTHRSPAAGVNFYRLKQIDFNDLAGTYSPIRQVFFEKDTSTEIAVYPNPSSGLLHLKSDNNEVLSWILFDPTGKVVLDEKNLVKTAQLDLSRFSKGIYFLTINSQSHSETKRILLTN
jgi:hypothetical protein